MKRIKQKIEAETDILQYNQERAFSCRDVRLSWKTQGISMLTWQWPLLLACQELPEGAAAAVCDLPWLLILQRRERRRTHCIAVKCVLSDRDEWRDHCGRCQSDNLASVSPGDPEEPSGWTRWTACCGERTTKMKKVKLIRYRGLVDCPQSGAMIQNKIWKG